MKIIHLGELAQYATWLLPKCELQQQYKLAETRNPRDYSLIATLGLRIKALDLEMETLAFSAEDYRKLPARHAALMGGVKGKCEELLKAENFEELQLLAAELEKLKRLGK